MSSVTSFPVFHKKETIKAHSDNINILVFSKDGRFLASGSDDGYILIFDTKDWTEFRKYRTAFAVRAIVWHPDDGNIISAGLKEGIINTIQVKSNKKWEHSSHGKLVAVGFDNQVLVAKQSSIATWSSQKYVPKPADFNGQEDITRSVHFHTEEKLLLVIYLYNGILAYDTEELGIRRWHIDTQGLCGDSALSATSRLLVTTNLFDGIDWYDTVNKRHSSKTLQAISPAANVPLPVIFLGTNIIAVGSATGKVSIFKAGNPEMLQVLDHNKESLRIVDEMVQALVFYSTYYEQNTHILVTGVSEQFDECSMTIWTAKGNKKPSYMIPWNTIIFAICGSLAGFSAIAMGRRHIPIASVNNYVLGLSQNISAQLSDMWPMAVRSQQDIQAIETHTHFVTRTVEVFETPLILAVVQCHLLLITYIPANPIILSKAEGILHKPNAHPKDFEPSLVL
ncbi:WD40-repeat-containing domain protein [Mycena leptocephala]|nr:WD40-repeat-containing domain protein [Mycena leptocephala]